MQSGAVCDLVPFPLAETLARCETSLAVGEGAERNRIAIANWMPKTVFSERSATNLKQSESEARIDEAQSHSFNYYFERVRAADGAQKQNGEMNYLCAVCPAMGTHSNQLQALHNKNCPMILSAVFSLRIIHKSIARRSALGKLLARFASTKRTFLPLVRTRSRVSNGGCVCALFRLGSR